MDIKQEFSALAALTLGKDMTFRDYAQGSFRMRGIGKGQTIALIIVPEIRQLICAEVAKSQGVSIDAVQQRFEVHTSLLKDVCAWLVINSMRSEKIQFNLLCEQSAANVWRKASYRQLMANHPRVGSSRCDQMTLESLNTFRERVDFAVENDTTATTTFAEELDVLVDAAADRGFLKSSQEQEVVNHVRSLVASTQNASIPAHSADSDDPETSTKGLLLFDGEQVQEQETEQETEQEIEQEKEEVLEIEQEVEEYIKQKYTRDDEVPKPWTLDSLTLQPSMGEQGFFPASEFAVLKKISVRPKPISFPPYLHISRNHYDPGWSLTTKRRLKNLICVMEYIPDASALSYGVSSEDEMTQEQIQCLRRIFALFDGNSDNHVDRCELEELINAIGVDMDADGVSFLDGMMENSEENLISFDQVKTMMQQQAFFRVQTGRHTVALSLVEAASVRAVLHMREDLPLCPSAPQMSACLRVVAPTSFSKVLGSSLNFIPSAKHQRGVANTCFRFIDSETHCSEEQLNVLLRSVQKTPCPERIEWFKDVLHCRRRLQKPWERTQLARLFTTRDQFQLIESRALRFRIRSLVKQKGLFVRDAFRAFNSSETGFLTCSEFYSGLCWLGLNISVPLCHDIIRSVDTDGDGLLTFADFKKSFYCDGDEQEVLEKYSIADDINALVIPQKKILELADELNGDEEIVIIPDEVVSGFKVKPKNPSDFKLVWSSANTMSRDPCSVWAPTVEAGWFGGDKFLACVGYYASSDNRAPANVELVRLRNSKGGRFSASDQHKADIIRRFLPHPRRFNQVWNKQLGEDSFFVWKPIPPGKNFVAIGMVVTTTDEPPERETVHCVPRRWVVPTAFEPHMIWDDSGTGLFQSRRRAWVSSAILSPVSSAILTMPPMPRFKTDWARTESLP
eukprot:SAG11_NODE_43_length_20795_cov_11.860456_4_plen_908_part_00